MNKLLFKLNDKHYKLIPGNPETWGSATTKATPNMTGRTTPSGEVIQSGSVGEPYDGWRAFNGDTGENYYWNSGGVTPKWLGYKFPEPIAINKYIFHKGQWLEPGTPSDWNIEASNDGITWDILDTRKGQTFWTNNSRYQSITYTFNNTKKYTHYRMKVLAVKGGISTVYIGEIIFYEAIITAPRTPGTFEEIVLTSSKPTKSDFELNGIGDISLLSIEDFDYLLQNDAELLCWTDQSVASKTANLIAVPKPQLLLPIGDIEVKELEQVIVSSSLIGTGDLKILISGDSGATWNGKAPVDIASLEDVKTNGFTTEEFNALTTQELITFIPSGKVRFAFYLEQENIEDVIQVNSLSVGERIYTMTPSIESLSVLYELLKYEQPTLFVSRDNGVTWKEVAQDTLTNISDLPEGKELKVKAVLSSGQELYGLSYSWI